jgi:hypothetical protein
MTRVGWAVVIGRRRRQRPVIRTARLPPGSADHSTVSIPTAEGPDKSLIAATVRRWADGHGRRSRLLRVLPAQLLGQGPGVGEQPLRLAEIAPLGRHLFAGDRQLTAEAVQLGPQADDLAGGGLA